ncbi:hypothetical protein GUJ93_ZPchr0003g17120 [Zizania palustris]|uniref:Uncharacterized protein n=1 Tax=Zizania palustris TaxID=103762 RepID=A0A8J5S6D5_ZIZPA|nr:hypothetical protein GUJ93_ZPchr0003g17120 [Zizania palustris]
MGSRLRTKASKRLQAYVQHRKPLFELGLSKGFSEATGLRLAWEAPFEPGLSRGSKPPFSMGNPPSNQGFSKASKRL